MKGIAVLMGFCCFCFNSVSLEVQHGQKQPSAQGGNPQVPQVHVSRAWKATRIAYNRPNAKTETAIRPTQEAYFFLVVELALRLGNTTGGELFMTFDAAGRTSETGIVLSPKKGQAITRADLLMTQDAAGNWGPPAGIVFSGADGVVSSVEAVLREASGSDHLPVLAAMNGFGYVGRFGDMEAFGGRLDPRLATRDGGWAPAPGSIVLVYELPHGRTEFRLKIGSSQPVAIDVEEGPQGAGA